MSTKIATYVNRFQSSLTKEKMAYVERIRAVDGLLTEHSLKAGECARALWSLTPEDKLASVHTSPVSHAKTVAEVLSRFGFTVADTDDDTTAAIVAAFRIATGKVTAKNRAAAIDRATSLSSFTLTADSATRYAALLKMVTALTAPKAPSARKTADEKVELSADDATVTGSTPVVSVPANITEVLSALTDMLAAIPADERGKWILKVDAVARKSRAVLTAELAAKETIVAAAKRAGTKVTA